MAVMEECTKRSCIPCGRINQEVASMISAVELLDGYEDVAFEGISHLGYLTLFFPERKSVFLSEYNSKTQRVSSLKGIVSDKGLSHSVAGGPNSEAAEGRIDEEGDNEVEKRTPDKPSDGGRNLCGNITSTDESCFLESSKSHCHRSCDCKLQETEKSHRKDDQPCRESSPCNRAAGNEDVVEDHLEAVMPVKARLPSSRCSSYSSIYTMSTCVESVMDNDSDFNLPMADDVTNGQEDSLAAVSTISTVLCCSTMQRQSSKQSHDILLQDILFRFAKQLERCLEMAVQKIDTQSSTDKSMIEKSLDYQRRPLSDSVDTFKASPSFTPLYPLHITQTTEVLSPVFVSPSANPVEMADKPTDLAPSDLPPSDLPLSGGLEDTFDNSTFSSSTVSMSDLSSMVDVIPTVSATPETEGNAAWRPPLVEWEVSTETDKEERSNPESEETKKLDKKEIAVGQGVMAKNGSPLSWFQSCKASDVNQVTAYAEMEVFTDCSPVTFISAAVISHMDTENGKDYRFLSRILIGRWETLLHRSNPLDPLFKILGISYIKRAIVDRLAIPLTITLQNKESTLDTLVHLPMGSRHMRWALDGSMTTEEDPDCGRWNGYVRCCEISLPWVDGGRNFRALQQVRTHPKIGEVRETRAVVPDEKHGRILYLNYTLFPKNKSSALLEVVRILKPIK